MDGYKVEFSETFDDVETLPADDAPVTAYTERVEVEPGFYVVDRITKTLASERFDRRFQAQQALAGLDAEAFAIVEFCAEGVWGR
jgi:hypothetical protein